VIVSVAGRRALERLDKRDLGTCAAAEVIRDVWGEPRVLWSADANDDENDACVVGNRRVECGAVSRVRTGAV
jgi:hypothetical protein